MVILSVLTFCNADVVDRLDQGVDVMTIRGDTVHLGRSDTSVTVVVLTGAYSCVDCFRVVARAVDSMSVSLGRKVSLIAVVRPGGGGMARRAAQRQAIELIGRKVPVYYDLVAESVNDAWPPKNLTGGIFGYFNVSRTPAVVIVASGGAAFIGYDELFDEVDDLKSTQTAEVVKTRLAKLISTK